jgi:hypothetical protein
VVYDNAYLSCSRLRTMLVIMTTASGWTSERILFQSYRRLHILYGRSKKASVKWVLANSKRPLCSVPQMPVFLTFI